MCIRVFVNLAQGFEAVAQHTTLQTKFLVLKFLCGKPAQHYKAVDTTSDIHNKNVPIYCNSLVIIHAINIQTDSMHPRQSNEPIKFHCR